MIAIPVCSSENSATSDKLSRETAGLLVFPVRIALDETSIRVDGEDNALTPGMSVAAEVKTGDRRMIKFLLDPLIEMKDEAFHERYMFSGSTDGVCE
jgi:hemolysin D